MKTVILRCKMMKNLIVLFSIFAALGVSAQSKVKLMYGKDWQRAGRDVKKMMESQAWKSLAKSQYITEFEDVEGGKPWAPDMVSLKLPVVFVSDAQGRCYCVIENIPYNTSAEKLLKKIKFVDEKRQQIEQKYGTDSIDGCGELMQAMEKYVGGPRRVISKGFYQDVYEKLKKLDPEDKEGWQRHFTMAFVLDGKRKECRNSDGLEIVEAATQFRKDGKIAEGEKFVEAQRKLPSKHLTLEQKQSLLMARFALYAPDDMNKPWSSPKREEMVTLLKRIADASEHTLWGTAALGYLGCKAINEPELSVYWGWKKGDFPSGKYELKIKYGITHSFYKAGEYTIDFVKESGGDPRIENLSIYCGSEEVAKLKPPFVWKMEKAYAGKVTHIVVRGTSGGDSSGKINIHRKVLRDRDEVK